MHLTTGVDALTGPNTIACCDVCHAPIPNNVGYFHRDDGAVCVACYDASTLKLAADRLRLLAEDNAIRERLLLAALV